MISDETAYKLKSAGFPQPAPEVGQWWYLGKNLQFIQTRHIEPGGIMAGDFCIFTPWSHFTKSLSAAQVLGFCAYCPTAGDIVAQLPASFSLNFQTDIDHRLPDFASEYDRRLVESLAQEWFVRNNPF